MNINLLKEIIREEIKSLLQEKATCCHKCGHSHVKGTPHPTPYRTGKNNCKYNK